MRMRFTFQNAPYISSRVAEAFGSLISSSTTTASGYIVEASLTSDQLRAIKVKLAKAKLSFELETITTP